MIRYKCDTQLYLHRKHFW